MPKRHNKRRLRGGGFFEGLQQSFTNFGNSVTNGASSIMNNTKKTVSSYQPYQTTSYQPSTSSMPSYNPSSSSSTPSMPSYDPSSSSSMSSYDPSSSSSMSSMSYGGSKRRRGTRRMRGGYMDNISSSNLAATAAKVGGRRRTRRTRKTRKGSRRMRGGYKASHSLTNIAATAAPVHGLETARAHNWVGGRRKKRRTRTRRH